MNLGIRTLLKAIFETKKAGKGRLGRGKIYVELMKIITDSDNDISLLFCGTTDRFLLRLLRGETDYPYLLFGLKKFEENMSNYNLYQNYIFKMMKFCSMVLDENKIGQLVYTLLEVIRQDSSIREILYGSEFISKGEFFGSFAHPKRICLEALLLGLLYHVHKNPAESENIELLNTPDRLEFHIVRFSDEESLDLEVSLNLIENIHENAKRQKSADIKYQIELQCGNTVITEIPDSRNIFLYGVGGAGKTTFLLNQINSNNSVSFYFSLYKYKREIHENLQSKSCWILLQILLKYHYQYEYQTYEACAACEGENVVLQQLSELDKQLKNNPYNFNWKYILLLDGLNEMSSELQEILTSELEWICTEWKNVRIIITGRTVPLYTVFDDFQHIEIHGITDAERDAVLSDYGEISGNKNLVEILKIPMFLNMYLENRETDKTLNTRGEILDSYIMGRNFQKDSVVRFIVQYVLPFVASKMINSYDCFAFQNNNGFCYEIDRGELFKTIGKSYKIYLLDEYVYQSYIAPKGFRKKSLLESREKVDFIELILDNIGLMKISENDSHKIHFTHQYFRDYFSAKHILNLLEIIVTSYKNSSIDEQKEIFIKFELDKNWFFDEHEIYKLFGEICGDYKNIPDGNDSMFWYRRTILDNLLDMYRKFNAESDCFHITENVIKVMSISRNNAICEVNFDRVPLPFNVPCNIKFSQNGEYPSSFKNCIVDRLGICDDSGIYISEESGVKIYTWYKYSVYSPDKKLILIISDDNYILLWDNVSEKILWNLDLSEYAEYCQYFDYAEFSADGNKIDLYAGCGINIYKVTIDSYSGYVIGYGQGRVYEYNFTDEKILDEQLKLKIFKQLPHFKNCDFSGAKFIYEDYSKILYHMGALTDNKELCVYKQSYSGT